MNLLKYRQRIFLKNSIDVAVVSYGGVGTTFLLEYVNKYRNANKVTNDDTYKHSPLPLISLNKGARVIYIYGDPRLAAISIFRRNFATIQSTILQRFSKRPPGPVPQDMTLELYAKERIDRFLFEAHFENWFERYTRTPTLFVKHDAIHDSKEAIAEFLNMPKSFLEQFPPEKGRSSNFEHCSSEAIEGLEYMYGNFAARIARLPPCELRMPSEKSKIDANYLKAIGYHGFTELRGCIKKIR